MKNIVISFLLTGSCAVSAMQSRDNVPTTTATPPTSPITGKFTKSDALAIATSRKANQKDDNNFLRLPHQGFSNKDRENSPSLSSSSSPSSSPQQSSPLSWRNSANWYDEKSLDK